MLITVLAILCFSLAVAYGLLYKQYTIQKKDLEDALSSRAYYKARYEKYLSLRGMKNTSLNVPEERHLTKKEVLEIASAKIMAICANRPKDTRSKHYYYQNGLLDSLEYFCKLIAKIS